MTANASPVPAVYASEMPRITRDVAAIGVQIDPHGAQPEGRKVAGSGKPEEGGGELRGGLTLANRFTAVIYDPEVPFDIEVTVGAHDGWLVAEKVTVSMRPDGPPVNAQALRATALSLYMQRVHQELQRFIGAGLLKKKVRQNEHAVVYRLPGRDDDWQGFAEMRRAVREARITPEIAAEAYKEALASLDPEESRRPTAAAAEKLGVSRGYISGLLSQARKLGIEGLGPGRPERRRDSQ